VIVGRGQAKVHARAGVRASPEGGDGEPESDGAARAATGTASRARAAPDQRRQEKDPENPDPRGAHQLTLLTHILAANRDSTVAMKPRFRSALPLPSSRLALALPLLIGCSGTTWSRPSNTIRSDASDLPTNKAQL
jgi:hypothetical protein